MCYRSVLQTPYSQLGFRISSIQTTIKVYTAPHKRNITVQYNFAGQSTAGGSICCQKNSRTSIVLRC
ncbi:hypothetical protein Hanom_Chr10g00912351 [Helianthus anomalus]